MSLRLPQKIEQIFLIYLVRISQKSCRRTRILRKNPYYKMMNDGDGGYTLHTERPLTQEVINAVAKVDGIKKFDASTPTLVSTNLEVFPGNVPMKDRYNDLVYAQTVPGTKNNKKLYS